MSRDGIRRSPVPHLVSDAELAELPHGLTLRSRRNNAKGSTVVEIVLTLPDGRKTTRAAGTSRRQILEGLKRASDELSLSSSVTRPSQASFGAKSPLGEVARAWRQHVEENGYRSKRNQTRRYKPSTLRTFDDFFAAHLAGKRDDEGDLTKPAHRILGRPIDKITASELREVFEHDWTDLSDPVKGKLHQVLTHIFEFATDQGCLPKNPMREVDGYNTQGRMQDDKYLSLEQMRALLGSIPTEDGTWKAAGVRQANYYRVHIKMLLFTGARINELASLRWEHISFSEESCSSYVTIKEQLDGTEAVSPKTRAGVRTIHLTDDLAADLQQHRLTQMRHAERCATRPADVDGDEPPAENSTDLVFTSPWGRRLNDRQFRKVLRKLSRAAGIALDVHPHSLRHTALTYWADAVNGNSKVFKHIAGWANREVSDRYVGVPRTALIDATKRFQRAVARKVI